MSGRSSELSSGTREVVRPGSCRTCSCGPKNPQPTKAPAMEKRTRVRFTSDLTLIRCRLAELDFRRHFRVHQRSTTICKYYLTGDPVRLWRTKETHHISHIRGRAKSTHWCPTLLMPIANQFLDRLGQGVKHAIFRPTRTNRIDRDSASRKRDGKIAHQRFHRSFGRSHGDPW